MKALEKNARKLAPGLRVIKTGMAATLCLCLSYAIPQPYSQPLCGVIVAAAAMGNSIDVSFRTGRDGAVSALLGALLGLLFSLAGHGNAGLCGIGVILTLYACVLLRLENGMVIGEIVFLTVMLAPPAGPHWLHALGCAANALLGILVALAVNLVVMPRHYAGEVKERYSKFCALAAQGLHAARAGQPAPCQELAAALEQLRGSIRAYVAERKLLRGSDEEVFRISCRLSTFQQLVNELDSLQALQQEEDARFTQEEREVVRRYHMARLERLSIHLRPSAEKPRPASPDQTGGR